MTDQQTSASGPPPDGGGPLPGPPLRRSRRNNVVSGVCGGLGRHYDIDPVIFRVVLAVLAIAGGVGLIAYGFAWLLIPMEGEDENEGRRLLSGRVEGPALTALLCALVGCGLLLSMLGNPSVLFFSVLVAGAVAGSAYWSRRRRRAEQEGAADTAAAHTGGVSHAGAHGGAPPETQAPPVPHSPSWWHGPLTKDGTSGTTGTGYLWGPADGPYDKKDDKNTAAARRSGGRRERTGIGGRTFLLAVAACAAGILASWDSQPLGSSLQIGLACALAAFGLGLVVSAFYGRTGAGTIIMALLTCALLASAAALPKSVTTDWVRTDWKPASASTVRPGYDIGTGVGTLDLSGLKLKEGQTVATRASVGAGQLKVIVSQDTAVKLTVDVGFGDLRLPGETQEDVDVSPGLRRELTLGPSGGGAPRGTLELDLNAGLGQVEVSRATTS
ncbi:PspC domain-containing protein [Streptomyces sp. NPDC004647]|uniref:PspC domain-containing protein n=1 Tax=Streptomyces sp. NPDC004647 TaxID=3154671 RepID=UPI00339EE11C